MTMRDGVDLVRIVLGATIAAAIAVAADVGDEEAPGFGDGLGGAGEADDVVTALAGEGF